MKKGLIIGVAIVAAGGGLLYLYMKGKSQTVTAQDVVSGYGPTYSVAPNYFTPGPDGFVAPVSPTQPPQPPTPPTTPPDPRAIDVGWRPPQPVHPVHVLISSPNDHNPPGRTD